MPPKHCAKVPAMDDRRVYDLRLGDILFDVRLSQGLTQREIAESLGVHVNQYQRLESGRYKITVYDLVRIAERLDVPVSRLLPVRTR